MNLGWKTQRHHCCPHAALLDRLRLQAELKTEELRPLHQPAQENVP